jgi:hypothetical protein
MMDVPQSGPGPVPGDAHGDAYMGPTARTRLDPLTALTRADGTGKVGLSGHSCKTSWARCQPTASTSGHRRPGTTFTWTSRTLLSRRSAISWGAAGYRYRVYSTEKTGQAWHRAERAGRRPRPAGLAEGFAASRAPGRLTDLCRKIGMTRRRLQDGRPEAAEAAAMPWPRVSRSAASKQDPPQQPRSSVAAPTRRSRCSQGCRRHSPPGYSSHQ